MSALPITFACGLYDRMLALHTGDMVTSAREAGPMGLRTGPVWSAAARRRVMKRPPPLACLEAPADVTPRSAPAAVVPARTLVHAGTTAAPPIPTRDETPAKAPATPVRVTAPVPATIRSSIVGRKFRSTAVPAPTRW